MLSRVRRFGEHREPGQAQLRGLGHREHQGVERLDEIGRVERAVMRDSEGGGEDRVLRGCVGHGHHHLLGEAEPVHQRTVDLRQGAQPERVLDPGRCCVGVDERPHRLRHPACTRKRGATSTAGLNASGLPWTAVNPIAATTIRLRASRSMSAIASAASASTPALLDMNASASPAPNEAVRVTGGSLGFSPDSTSAVVASAARSPVPMLPPSRTDGNASAADHVGQGFQDPWIHTVAVRRRAR